MDDLDDLERRLDVMLESGEPDGEVIDAILARAPDLMALPPTDPRRDRFLAKINQAVGDQPATPTLNIEDFYRPGDTPYVLQWPLAPQTQSVLVMPFESLDHKTQFFVLFQEWTRRELDANNARASGRQEVALAIFEECLARADQLDVPELRARSHLGLASVYEALGDSAAERRELRAAQADRGAAVP